MMGLSRAAIVIAFGIAAADPGAPMAAESLGDPVADAIVASLEAKDPSRPLTCRLRDDTVLCSGARTGDCVDEGWLLSHDGSECRRRLERDD